ncbi:MAG: glycerate kinase [Candidatus Aminicenantaceae bacterium]
MTENEPQQRGDLRRLREDAEAVFRAGLEAVDPICAVERYVGRAGDTLTVGERDYDLSKFERIFVVGAGKASAAMGQAIETILGDRITDGFINVKYGHTLPLKTICLNEAGHPVPDEAGLDGARYITDLLETTGDKDLVLCLLSGGGSALLPLPAAGLSLADKQEMTRLLLESGATIQEINALRKHVSGIKGGHLARAVFPSTLITLFLSDVIGDDLDSIASGPTVPDSTTFGDCREVVERYGLTDRLPPGILDVFEKGVNGELPETPKTGDPVFNGTQNLIVAGNLQSLQAARSKAESLGYNTLLLSSTMDGETRDVARVHAALAREIRASGNPVAPPACLLSGGETTVSIRGKGLGGRNQEFVLAAALAISGLEGVVVLSAGTDGTDGPTDAAGAVADGRTVMRAGDLGLDSYRFLRDNDSYRFFQPLGDLLITGPTLTNVMDLRIVLLA